VGRLTSVVAGLGLLALFSHLLPADDAANSVLLLIGLAVGVDYSLFYIKREREERAKGLDKEAALNAAAATSGRSVLVSGLTVLIAMAGMYFTGNSIFQSIATGTILVVAISVLGSLTVLPAMLSLLGDRVNKGRIPFVHKLLRGRDGTGGERDQRCRPVGGGQVCQAARRQRGRKIKPVQGFRRGTLEIRVAQQALKHPLVHLARPGQCAIPVKCLTGVAADPVIQRPVAGAGVEGDQLALPADPGDVRDAADIEDGERLWQVPGQGGMINRRKRRTFAPGGDIGGPEVMGNRQAGLRRQARRIANLPGPPAIGLMQDRLAMEADEVRRMAQRFDRLRVVIGQARHRMQQAGIIRPQGRGAIQDPPQLRPQPGIIRDGQCRPKRLDGLAVRVDPGGVDPIQRGSAHQPDCPRHFPPLC